MLIAIEEHWVSPAVTAALTTLPPDRADASLAFNERGDHAERLADLDEGRLATMDSQGIDLAVVSHAPPGTHPLDGPDAVPLCRDANDALADAVGRHPARLRGMATLPMADPEASVAELERAADRGHVGTMVYGRAGDRPLDDPAYDELFATAARRGLPVFIHPQIPPRVVREVQYGGLDPLTDLGLATFGWGWHLEAATAALRLILRGTLDRHPDLQIVLGHWGELLLFWLDRADPLARLRGLERPSVSDYVRSNVHITSSGMFNPALLRHVLTVTTPHRLLFSTDYPFQHPTAAEIQAFLGEVAEPDREAVAAGNARRLFGLES
ncbi:amidohydrolase family protein [Actinomycetospora chlora]|uniref:Amidohydrolase family protein n=1 Tax=Actinomycetospora chlora TaxID=663608 RepID=A0ABP9BA77_9PSEU